MSTNTKASVAGIEASSQRIDTVVTDLAERLTDPGEVAAAARAADNVDLLPGMPSAQPPWGSLGLGEGHAGAALLYAELSHTDERFRAAAHAHLAAAVTGLSGPTGGGLFGGAASLAFAAHAARHTEDD